MNIITHSGTFHADDIFGTLVLEVVFSDRNPVIVRSRDTSIVKAADATVDVGGVYDASMLRFDHHQKGFADSRENGVVYASAGLVWKSFGSMFVMEMSRRITPSAVLSDAEASLVADLIDSELVQYVDMVDTGANPGAPGLYGLSSLLSQFNPSLVDDQFLTAKYGNDDAAYKVAKEELQLTRFKQAMKHLYAVLLAVVRSKMSELRSRHPVLNAERIENGKILILTQRGVEWEPVVHRELPDVLLVVFPESADTNFHVQSVSIEPGSFTNKLPLPERWAGLRDKDLAAVTGIRDSVFFNNNRFVAGARSIDSAIQLAKLALQ
jgi:uncharacterized UPF0160 family protein